MGVGVSTFLIALGAVLRYAVTFAVAGFNLHMIGVILMIVGVIGLVLSLIFWSSWGGPRRGRTVSVTREDPYV